MLTDYECGRVSAYAEWVALGGKPIAEVSRCRTDDEAELREQLEGLVGALGLSVRVFVEPVGAEHWAYGVYRHKFALEAWRHLTEKPHEDDGLVGLLFGYNADSVAGFTSASDAPATTSPRGDGVDMAGTSRPC